MARPYRADVVIAGGGLAGLEALAAQRSGSRLALVGRVASD